MFLNNNLNKLIYQKTNQSLYIKHNIKTKFQLNN